jgi:hypothetical protein
MFALPAATLCCIVAAIVIYRSLARTFDRTPALLALAVLLTCTAFPWHSFVEPSLSVGLSLLAASVLVVLHDDGTSPTRPVAADALMGAACGLLIAMRWENAAFLLLPAARLFAIISNPRRPTPRNVAIRIAVTVAGLSIGFRDAVPVTLGLAPRESLSWREFHLLDALFSSRHGLLAWTPVLWLGFLGFVPLIRRRNRFAAPLFATSAVATVLNAWSPAWWGDESFSNDHFAALLPLLTIGIAATIEKGLALIRTRPQLVVGAFSFPFLVWNLTLAEQTAGEMIPRDDTVSFPRLVSNSWQVVADRVGSPNTWPASWWFAARHDRPPSQYDLLAGRQLFSSADRSEAIVDLGGDDLPFIAEGWGRPERDGDITFRRVRRAARLLLPPDAADGATLRLHSRSNDESAVDVAVRVFGTQVGRFTATSQWREQILTIPARTWRNGLNEITFDAMDTEVRLDRMVISRR